MLLDTIVVSLVWLLFLGNHLPTYGLPRAFLCLTVLLAAVVFLYGGSSQPPSTPALLSYMQAHDFRLADCWQTSSYGRIEL